jgi:hypothetical protein
MEQFSRKAIIPETPQHGLYLNRCTDLIANLH